MSSSRPIYIPPKNRKQKNNNNNKKPERFHGAFTGGFSAGYFNTVDTKEGWKPATEKKTSQALEEFMDDQDHQEWGGPTNVRQEYNPNNANTAAAAAAGAVHPSQDKTQQQQQSLDSLLQIISHPTVGPRLLRVLGWRSGGTVFVPQDDDDHHHAAAAAATTTTNDDDEEARVVLSKKKLRQIQLRNSKSIRLPPPKLDECGLGFEPHLDAPEFRQYKERRQQLARERARGGPDTKYRTSHLSNNNDNNNNNNNNNDDSNHNRRHNKDDDNDNNNDNHYVSFETAEDFIGKRSVGGFALRDDEDDAYDATTNTRSGSKPPTDLGEEYNTEVYEHEMSDDDDDDVNDAQAAAAAVLPTTTSNPSGTTSSSKKKALQTDLSNALASWANTTTTSATNDASSSSAVVVGLTSDGRPPLSGFVLGGSIMAKKRYPGPDIPRTYDIIRRRHAFGENEHPLILQTMARAVQLEEQHRQSSQLAASRTTATTTTTAYTTIASSSTSKSTSTSALAGKQFASLATAMKNRFTAGQAKEESNGPPGLHRPIILPPVQEAPPDDDNDKKKKEEKETKEGERKPITVRRTVQPFTPLPLVCKRFGVSVPRNNRMGGVAAPQVVGRLTEADYFEKEIILAARNNESSSSVRQNAAPSSSSSSTTTTPKENNNTTSVEDKRNHKTEEEASETEGHGPTGIPRPPMEKLKSIYEPESEESSDPDTDLDSIDDENGRPTQHDDDDDDDDDRKKQAEDISEMPDDQLMKKNGGQPDGPRDTVNDSQKVVVYEAQRNEGEIVEYEKSSSSDDSSSQHKERKRKHRRKERHRRRKRSRSPDDSGSSGDRKRKKDRRRKHEKKRHKKSSHRRKRHKES
jgi:G patch domain-containing protein 1